MAGKKSHDGIKILIAVIIAIALLSACFIVPVLLFDKSLTADSSSESQSVTADGLAALPAPTLSEGVRGEQFGIDANINEETIDQYLDRPDTVYRDMRLLEDPANYAAIGGDSYLSGFVRGFEVVPYPYLVNATDLPPEVGQSYIGPTLFTRDEAGNYKPNYAESMAILEYLFPKDKNIFVMCGGGGYAGMTKNMLVALGWDANKIYNVGAYWSYDGANNIPVKNTSLGDTIYDFWKVPYHHIDFNSLHALK